MNKLDRITATRAIAPALAAIAMVLAGQPAVAEPVLVDRIVAVVNSEVVTRNELAERVERAIRQLRRQGTELPPREAIERQILERLILDRAQLQMARETGIRVDDATVERAVGRVAASNRLSISEFRQALADDDISWEVFRDNIREEILVARLREREVDARVVVTDAEVDNFIESNRKELTNQEFDAAHILFRAPEGATPEQLASLRARAEQVLERLQAGEDFARLAATFSDAQDALDGGRLGWRTASRLPTLFAEALQDLQPGASSPVLRSPAGFHIVQLIDRRGGALAGPSKVTQTRARHILIKTSEVLTDADARRRLEGLRERVVNGAASFEDLAQVHSTDLSAAKGGDLGWLYPGDTVPPFERAMNALQRGEISAPVQSPFGWHLIQVVDRRNEDVSEERRRNAARNALRERKAEEAYQDWLRQVRDSAFVELRDEG